jgi:hypothetical protein
LNFLPAPSYAQKVVDTGLIIKELDMCVAFLDTQVVIKNKRDYQTYLSRQIDRENCSASYKQPRIDFSRYAILGFFAEGEGKTEFFRSVVRQDSLKRYVYSIVVKEYLVRKVGLAGMNFVLVPQLPVGYTVQFELKKETYGPDIKQIK